MGSVDVTTRRHRPITTFIIMKSHCVISLGAITGQADNAMLNAMQSVPAYPNTVLLSVIAHVDGRCCVVVSRRSASVWN